jgi:hypothetical protein
MNLISGDPVLPLHLLQHLINLLHLVGGKVFVSDQHILQRYKLLARLHALLTPFQAGIKGLIAYKSLACGQSTKDNSFNAGRHMNRSTGETDVHE